VRKHVRSRLTYMCADPSPPSHGQESGVHPTLSAPESTPEQQHSNDTSLAPSKDPVRSRNPLNPQNCGASMQSAQKCARCELRGAVRRGMRKQNTVWLPASACHPPLCAQPARNSRSRTRTPPGTISRSEISVRSGLPRSQSPSAQSPSPLSYALPLPPLPRCRVSRLAVPSARRAELPPCQHWAAPQRIHARGEGGERGSAIRPPTPRPASPRWVLPQDAPPPPPAASRPTLARPHRSPSPMRCHPLVVLDRRKKPPRRPVAKPAQKKKRE